MKIVTYNVNGLRPRVAQHGSLLKLLNSLDADIICLQETKLSRQDLSADLAMADGYEAIFSFNRNSGKWRTGYSGVATFCRVTSAFSSSEVALPLAAEEGFTGLRACSQKRGMITKGLIEMPFNGEGLENVTNEDLLKVDSEGRCVITDHGHFVLFNLYGPRAVEDDDERIQFKLLFYKILQKRWETLLDQGRRVFVAGDLNIAPAAIDKCDADADFERNKFREWLRSLLRQSGGPFFDAFRSKHPDRKEAYTCFAQNAGAEEFNYGSRIDHILIAGSCLHQKHDMEGHNLVDCHVEDCDILYEFMRGKAKNAPKWKGGRSIKLEGSDHLPVYVNLNDMPDLPVHSTPPLAVRYFPEVRGCQQTIESLLVKREDFSNVKCHGSSNLLPVSATENCNESPISSQDVGKMSKVNVELSVSDNLGQGLPSSNSELHGITKERLKGKTENILLKPESGKAKLSPKCHKTVRKKVGRSTSSQLTIKSFFQQPKVVKSGDLNNMKTDTLLSQADTSMERDDLVHPSEEVTDGNPLKNEDDNGEVNDSNLDPFNEVHVDKNPCSSKREIDNVAMMEWQRIQQKMKMTLPLCKGHGEPCVARSVKKGPNIGRQFYTCARAKILVGKHMIPKTYSANIIKQPLEGICEKLTMQTGHKQGPASNPEANCDYFKWASTKFKRKQM